VNEKNKITVHHSLNGKYFLNLTKARYMYLGLLVAFILIATVISWGYSRDSVNYNRLFEMYGTSGWGLLSTEMFHRETFFLVVSKVVYNFGLASVYLFLTYSTLSLSVKFYLISKHSKDELLSLSLFFSYFFILHDSTQIRFGVAIAFVYMGLHFLAENRKLLFAAIVIISAVMFHFSIIAFIIMLLFTTNDKSQYLIFGMIVVAIVLYPVNLDVYFLDIVGVVVSHFGITETFLNTVHSYLLMQSPTPLLGMFRPIMLLLYFCAIVIFQNRRNFNNYEMLCYNAFLLSILFYILLKDVVILQVRFTDMFGFSLVFLVPFVHSTLSSYIGKRNAYIILLSFFAAYLLKFTLYDKMLIL